MSFFAELKRRHVYRVAIAYAIVGWMLIEVGSTIVPALHLPGTLTTAIVVLVLLGFPIAVVLAWAFEITPGGVRRTEPVDSPDARVPEQHRRVGRKLDYAIIAVLVLALAVMAWQRWGSHTASPSLVNATQKSIAVLPFENLSTDKNNGYFADGMQDLILTKLADIGDLKVISRTSTAKYASHPEDLTKIAEQLGVTNILEGSVQKAGNSVLINVQLINARTDAHIWAESYQRTLDNVFGVEGEVAGKIADALKAKLSPAETKRLATALSNDPAANDLYLRGDYSANRGSINYDTAAMKQAIAFYRQAITKAPDFAQARAQLSYMESQLAWFGGGGERTAPLYADALTQAEQALKLAPDLADAHLALGYHDYWGKGDYAVALKAFAAALSLRPNDSDAMAAKAYVLRRQGKFNEAIGEFQKALALDPRNTSLAFEMGSTYMTTRRYARAEQTFKRALALDPANINARSSYAEAIVLGSGDLSKAMARMQGDQPRLKLEQVKLLTWARKYEQALTLLQSIPDSPDTFNLSNGGPKALFLAKLYGLRGDSAKSRELYAKALPQARAQYAALAGSPVINQAVVLLYVAHSELGMGQTKAGLADTAKILAIAEHTNDHNYGPILRERSAELYAQAGRADKAVRVLSAALATPGGGGFFSPVMLWIDPTWDPIRKSPAFQALLKQYASSKPATIPAEAGSG